MRLHYKIGLTMLALPLTWLSAIATAADDDGAVEELPAGIAAKVGEISISHDDVLSRVYGSEKSKSDPAEQHVRSAYQYLMQAALLRCEAKALGIVVSDDDRKWATQKLIDESKREIAESTGNALPWGQYLREIGHTEESFYKVMYDESEVVVLAHLVLNYFKLTTESVTYSDVRLVRYEDALKIKEKLDAGEDFDRLALLNSVDRRQGVRVAFRHQGLPKQVEEMLFDTLEPKKYSGIITAGEGDYRIVMLKSRFKGESKTYQELKETIEKTFHEGGIRTPETFEQWVAVMYNTGKYAVRFRFPGETTKSTSTPARKDVK